MNYTTIEQSKRLLELGLDPNTADMNHYEKDDGWVTLPKGQISYGGFKIIPCWSSDRLLEFGKDAYGVSNFDLSLCNGCWYLSFRGYDYKMNHKLRLIHESYGFTIIEATYNMMVWLLTNGYIKG